LVNPAAFALTRRFGEVLVVAVVGKTESQLLPIETDALKATGLPVALLTVSESEATCPDATLKVILTLSTLSVPPWDPVGPTTTLIASEVLPVAEGVIVRVP
jgi:hypothetical protein